MYNCTCLSFSLIYITADIIHFNQKTEQNSNQAILTIQLEFILQNQKQRMEKLTLELKSLQHRSFSQPLYFSIHVPRKHQSKHLEITKKRPKWMAKGGRNIFLNKEMAVPGEPITS